MGEIAQAARHVMKQKKGTFYMAARQEHLFREMNTARYGDDDASNPSSYRNLLKADSADHGCRTRGRKERTKSS
jgi:hypothetical protein